MPAKYKLYQWPNSKSKFYLQWYGKAVVNAVVTAKEWSASSNITGTHVIFRPETEDIITRGSRSRVPKMLMGITFEEMNEYARPEGEEPEEGGGGSGTVTDPDAPFG